MRRQLIADNKRARFDYEISDVIEAGIILTGSEVKSLRQGRISLAEAYAGPMANEDVLYLYNLNIPEYKQANWQNHEPKRPRKLLLRKRQLRQFLIAVERKGMTIVPLNLYFNDKGIAKLEIAIGKGKKLHDKRETIKERDWQRNKLRLLRQR